KIPEPRSPPDAYLRLFAFYPAGMIEDLPLAQAHRVPPQRRMIPVARQHARQRRAAEFYVGGVIRPEGDFGDADFLKKFADTFHVLSPVEIGIGHEIFRMAA